MALRPIYEILLNKPFYVQKDIEFKYYSGFSIVQKQKSIESLHSEYIKNNSQKKVLEISSKSPIDLGVKLSAFNLMVLKDNKQISVETLFQASKCFENGGPYTDLLDKTSREAKKDLRLHESGNLIKFQYGEEEFPLNPKTYFYDWLYIHALNNVKDLQEEILDYDAFTDIEFNPNKSINCQARSAAIFVSLKKSNLLMDALSSKENFKKIVY